MSDPDVETGMAAIKRCLNSGAFMFHKPTPTTDPLGYAVWLRSADGLVSEKPIFYHHPPRSIRRALLRKLQPIEVDSEGEMDTSVGMDIVFRDYEYRRSEGRNLFFHEVVR